MHISADTVLDLIYAAEALIAGAATVNPDERWGCGRDAWELRAVVHYVDTNQVPTTADVKFSLAKPASSGLLRHSRVGRPVALTVHSTGGARQAQGSAATAAARDYLQLVHTRQTDLLALLLNTARRVGDENIRAPPQWQPLRPLPADVGIAAPTLIVPSGTTAASGPGGQLLPPPPASLGTGGGPPPVLGQAWPLPDSGLGDPSAASTWGRTPTAARALTWPYQDNGPTHLAPLPAPPTTGQHLEWRPTSGPTLTLPVGPPAGGLLQGSTPGLTQGAGGPTGSGAPLPQGPLGPRVEHTPPHTGARPRSSPGSAIASTQDLVWALHTDLTAQLKSVHDANARQQETSRTHAARLTDIATSIAHHTHLLHAVLAKLDHLQVTVAHLGQQSGRATQDAASPTPGAEPQGATAPPDGPVASSTGGTGEGRIEDTGTRTGEADHAGAPGRQ